jgi:TctA family transporter
MRLVVGSPIHAYDAVAKWMHLFLLTVSVFLIMTERSRHGDEYARPRKFEMRGHCLLGPVTPESSVHTGQTPALLAELDAGTAGEVALQATLMNKFSDAGSRFYILEDGKNRVMMESVGTPELEPEIGESVVAMGSIRPVVGWKDHAAKRAMALGVFLLSGLLGIALLVFPGTASRNIFLINFQSIEQGTVLLFPLFTGLFGISTLLLSLKDSPKIPEQKIENVKVRLPLSRQFKSIGSGSIASIASWFPGISAAISTIISVFLTRPGEPDSEERESETLEFIVSVSAVNTSVALFNLMALFVILKSRSGAMKSVEALISSELVAWEPLGAVPLAMSALLFSALLAAIVSVPLTLFFGKLFARYCSRINYELMVKSVIMLLLVMVALFAGALGLAILAVATCVGMIPPLIGVKRVHLMGCLIIPVIIFFI